MLIHTLMTPASSQTEERDSRADVTRVGGKRGDARVSAFT